MGEKTRWRSAAYLKFTSIVSIMRREGRSASGNSGRVDLLQMPKGVGIMGISAVGHGATQAATAAPKTPPTSAEGSPQVATAKKDVAVISEKAKDLAALKAGKSASEEANESMSAKAQEASESAAAQAASKT